MSKRIASIIYVVCTIILISLWYLTMPVINFNFWGLPILFVFYGALIFGLNIWLNNKFNLFGAIIIAISLIFIIIVPFFNTSAIFHSQSYRSLIGNIEEGIFSGEISPIDVENIRLVDQDMARKLGDKKLGEDPALGSQSQLGVFNIQKVQDKLYWVAPLQHRSFWKWNDNREGTKGYIMVSATNPQDVKLIQEVEEKPIRIKYQPMGYFNDNLRRHIYFNGYLSMGTSDYSFEINDEGKPFWVITLFQKEVGYAGNNATGVLVVDAETGKLDRYDINNAPLWVDRIQPEDFIQNQLNDWGSYVKGWLNSFLAEEGVLQASPGTSLVYGENNNSYWYTGMTSSGNDESTIGFVLVNTRTKEAKLYKQAGATEEAAMGSAEGKVQEMGYQATYPIMYNIIGVPTYVCSLKDNAGLVKMVAMISVKDYTILGIGESKLDALRAYRSALMNRGDTTIVKGEEAVKTLEGKVLRVSTDIRNGSSLYYMVISGAEHKIFIGTSNVSQEVPLTNVGDTVSIKYGSEDSPYIDIAEFDNKELVIK